METTRKRRWWQFGLRWLFVAMLVVAAYGAGYSHRRGEMQAWIDRSDTWERRTRLLTDRLESEFGYGVDFSIDSTDLALVPYSASRCPRCGAPKRKGP